MMADPLSPVSHIDHLRYMSIPIDDLHYSYLYAHESLPKLEEKKKLEGHIKEFLMVAPHDRKFYYPETSVILHRSAEFKENFNGIRASAAWTAVAAYAHNLLAQSWRREFREIKTYSGFYKHNIESGLLESELMLTLMGYRNTADGTFTLDGPVDPDKVAYVSRDSLIALVECQILSSLYTDLMKRGYQYSWLDILQYRETHPCTIEQALNGLIYQYNPRYLNACRLDCYSKSNMMDCSPYKSLHYRTHSNIHLPYYDVPDGVSMMTPYIGNSLSKCNSCLRDYSSTPLLRQNSTCSVPTGQLIELDVSYHGRDSYIYDTDNLKKTIDKIETNGSYLNTNDSNSNMVKSKYNNDPGLGATWGPTYPSSESKNIPKYDKLSDQRHVPCNDWDESFKVLHLDDSQPSCSTTEQKSYDNPTDKISKKKPKHDANNIVPSSSQTLGREIAKKSDFNYMSLKVKLNEKWECPTCTYHNTNGNDVCEMCSKSKVIGNEVQPLVSGGRQCPKCTLVNEKGVNICDACGTNLKDSPTYI